LKIFLMFSELKRLFCLVCKHQANPYDACVHFFYFSCDWTVQKSHARKILRVAHVEKFGKIFKLFLLAKAPNEFLSRWMIQIRNVSRLKCLNGFQ
jgi:hypothetical protein